LCEILDVYYVTCRSYCDYCIRYLFYHRPAVFKLGSADQRGSATGSHGVRERIPKSSNCFRGFFTIYDPYVFKFAHISQSLSLSALRGSVAVVWHDRHSVDDS